MAHPFRSADNTKQDTKRSGLLAPAAEAMAKNATLQGSVRNTAQTPASGSAVMNGRAKAAVAAEP